MVRGRTHRAALSGFPWLLALLASPWVTPAAARAQLPGFERSPWFGEQVREALIAQIASPVRWVDCAQALAGAGATTFLEVGPGRVLSGLVKQILGMETDASAVDSAAKIESFAASRTAAVE